MKKIFVITPIGEKGSDIYKRFDAIFNKLIKPAFYELDYDDDFEVIKANDINKPGSFVNNILENLYTADIVIANLTGLNPNVLYELGIRHALSNRTILITEDLKSIPSDLKEYRAIDYKYDMSEMENFKESLTKALSEILENPNYLDSPVQLHLPHIIENRENSYKKEIEILTEKLEKCQNNLRKDINKSKIEPIMKREELKVRGSREYLFTRLNRILELRNIKRAFSLSWDEGPEYSYSIRDDIPLNFKLYSTYHVTDIVEFDTYFEELKEIFFYSELDDIENLNSILADIRIMLTRYKHTGTMQINFIIATDIENFDDNNDYIFEYFKNAKEKAGIGKSSKFKIEIWNDKKLTEFEKELGIIL